MISIINTKKIFLDFDGVIVNSNYFKEMAISDSIFEVVDNSKLNNEAINYFNEFAGLGRNVKLNRFFSTKEVASILALYNLKCTEFYLSSLPTLGCISLLKKIKFINSKVKIYMAISWTPSSYRS